MAAEIISGEDKAWDILSGLDAADVCRRSGASGTDEPGVYLLQTFGKTVRIDTGRKKTETEDPSAQILLTKLVYFYRLSALWYLVKSLDAAPSGRLVKPTNLPDGDMFFKGSHVLPLEAVAKRYSSDREGFRRKAAELGGRQVSYGDAAFELLPFPRVPVTIILWLSDEEWDARVDLLFDSTAPLHLPVDILWSIAMMSLLILL